MVSRALIYFLIFFFGVSPALAYVASSTNYQLERDSINFAGGLSTSTNYGLESTAGETGTGILSSSTYSLYAGYQQMDSAAASTLTISSPANVTLSPSIPETGGGTAEGSAIWTVTTNNADGYTLAIAAGASPALAYGSATFADYDPAGAVPDFTFAVGTTESVFAFSPSGSHLATRYKDNGATCGTGSSDTSDACWDGFSTSNVTIAQSASATPSGTATTVNLRAAAGTGKTQTDGDYSATITVTATAL